MIPKIKATGTANIDVIRDELPCEVCYNGLRYDVVYWQSIVGINVELNNKGQMISVDYNGRTMTPEEYYTIFNDVEVWFDGTGRLYIGEITDEVICEEVYQKILKHFSR